MAEITAAAVKSLRERTNLPMMDCKKALEEARGDVDKAVEVLRKAGAKLMEKRAGRSTTAGRIAIYAPPGANIGTMIDLHCESTRWPTTISSCNWPTIWPSNWPPVPARRRPTPCCPAVAQQGRADAEAAVRRPEQQDPRGLQAGADRADRRALRRLRPSQRRRGRPAAVRGRQRRGGPRHLHARHRHASRRAFKEDLDPAVVDKEREILSAAARKEGKPENIIAKMVEGRLRNFYAECCLAEQPFVKDDKKTVAQVAKETGMKLVSFVRWELPKE